MTLADLGSVPRNVPETGVSPQIRSLANLIMAKKAAGQGKRFVLMLGAGASMDSGVRATPKLMQDLVDTYGADITGPPPLDLDERFARLWRRSTPDERGLFLKPELTRQPSLGYEKLALLIKEGVFDLVVTFNFDRLLEQALDNLGFTDVKVIIRGETEISQIARLVEEPVAKLTILKLHGGLRSADTFLFDPEEMLNYPPPIEALVKRITARDLIVCGYSFSDACVMRAFAETGGTIVCVNRSGAPLSMRGFLYNRRSQDRVFSGEGGRFDSFFGELADEILAPPPSPSPAARPPRNPFKFLAAYEASEKDWFLGRKRLRQQALGKLVKEERTVLHLIGPPKSGKTSFVRAGLIAYLDNAAFEPIYLRCRSDLDRRLAELVAARQPQAPPPTTLKDALAALRGSAARPTVLFLDQFERVARGFPDTDAGWRQLLATFSILCESAGKELRLVLVTNDEKHYRLVLQSRLANELKETIDVNPLPSAVAKTLFRFLVKRSDLSFEPRLLDALVQKLGGPPGTARPFTLAHLQALCYLLVTRACTTWDKYQAQISLELENALDSAISDCDIMNFLEEFPTKSERRLVRSFMQVVPEPSQRLIATFIKDRFADLLRDAEFPEPIA